MARNQTQNAGKDPLLTHADRLTQRARAWLFWEEYALIFAVAALIISVFLIAAFAGIWERIGDPWRLITLFVAVYFIVKSVLSARKTRVPTQSDAARRVERDNSISHRPLDVLRDNPVMSGELWDKHVLRARQSAVDLRPAKPVSVLAPKDKYFLRFAAPLALVLALMVGAGDNLERLKRSLTPGWQGGISAKGVTFDAWVDPPDYTGRPPVYFRDKRKVEIPAGSELVARISGTKDAPRLKITTDRGSRYLGLTRLGPTSFEARTTLTRNAAARWRIGTFEKRWRLTVLPDTPPTVTLDAAPKADKRDRLAMTYSLSDDFGVTGLMLEMRLLDDPDGAAQMVAVPLSSSSVRSAKGRETALNLTKHIWTGRKVSGRLVATDGLGQSAMSQFENFTVPDKIFIEPLAKAVVEQRNLVLAAEGKDYAPLPRRTRKEWANMPYFDTYQTDSKLGRAPASVQRAALLIEAVTDEPSGLYEDPAVYLGLKNVLWRMRYARNADMLVGIEQDLWNIAIRAEFGVLGTALQEMQEAEAALNEGIARRAPEREIDTLFDRYNAAVDRYMEELRRKAIMDGNVAESDGGGGGGGRNADEIKELLKAIEEANARGDSEGARKALKQLAELLENMQMQMAQGGSGGEGGDPSQGELSEEEKKALEDLADLLGEQRELKDETEQSERAQQRAEQQGSQEGGNSSGGQSGQQPGDDAQADNAPKSADELAQQQALLEDLLGKLEDGLPASGALREGGDDGRADGDAKGNGEQAGGQSGDESQDGAQAGGGGETDPDGQGTGGGERDDARSPTKSPEEALADANEAMGRAQDALKSGDLAGASEAQKDAIQALRDAAGGILEAAQRRGNQDGENQSAEGGSGNPLGQNQGDQNDDFSDADLDQRDNATRSRELMEELRRRASEQERDEAERNYLERLLERF
ncbi:DUF4175 domain-containing protein [Fretibacter rubidus]|uniref:DUF4175 domain-containing protein n=1 Tax=Fretibacter rubidus TaxID=570162 RepID=UPI00352AD2AD